MEDRDRTRRGGSRVHLGGFGFDLVEQLQDCLHNESTIAQTRLTDAFEAWSINEIQRRGRRPSEQLMQQMRVAVMGPTLRGSRTSLSSLRSDNLTAQAGADDEDRSTEMGVVVESAQRARNLINHRRKVVRGVLRAITAPGNDDDKPRPAAPGGSRSSRPVKEPLPEHVERAEHLRRAHIEDPAALGEWAAECFELYVDVQRTHTQWSSALANNHKAEWLDFLLLLEPAMPLNPRDRAWLAKRDNFEERFSTTLRQLRMQAGKPLSDEDEVPQMQQDPWAQQSSSAMLTVEDVQSAPAGAPPAQQAIPAGYRSVFEGVRSPMAAPEPQGLPVAAQAPAAARALASAPGDAATTASFRVVRSGEGFAIVINADAYAIDDLEDAALTLSLELLAESDPTEVEVLVLPGPPRLLELRLSTRDTARVKAAAAKARQLLGGQPSA